MIIVLEGPDGAGKSTLGRTLSAFLGVPLLHTGGPPETAEAFRDKMRSLESFIEVYKSLIIDRLPPISEHVYGEEKILTSQFLETDFL